MRRSGNPKPTAALSATLLARKGMARPAMRRPDAAAVDEVPNQPDDARWNDDLGWNDMVGDSLAVPPVLHQRAALQAEFGSPPVARAISLATAARIERETRAQHSAKRPRSAFTLRLDEDRHLRLRLASALHNASAQSLVTAALDQFLHTQPDVDALLRQLPTRAKQ